MSSDEHSVCLAMSCSPSLRQLPYIVILSLNRISFFRYHSIYLPYYIFFIKHFESQLLFKFRVKSF